MVVFGKIPYDSVKIASILNPFIELILNDYTSVLSVGQYRTKLLKGQNKTIDIINTTVFTLNINIISKILINL